MRRGEVVVTPLAAERRDHDLCRLYVRLYGQLPGTDSLTSSLCALELISPACSIVVPDHNCLPENMWSTQSRLLFTSKEGGVKVHTESKRTDLLKFFQIFNIFFLILYILSIIIFFLLHSLDMLELNKN
jgi:hypothetical protein